MGEREEKDLPKEKLGHLYIEFASELLAYERTQFISVNRTQCKWNMAHMLPFTSLLFSVLITNKQNKKSTGTTALET